VNNDGFVSAIDQWHQLHQFPHHDPPLTHPAGERYYDVNNDGYVTAIDVLQVINETESTRRRLRLAVKGFGRRKHRWRRLKGSAAASRSASNR
jgi:hypothetical protein